MNKNILVFLVFICLNFCVFPAEKYEPKVYYSTEKNGEYIIYGDNPAPVPMQIEIELLDLSNMKSDKASPLFIVLPENSAKNYIVKLTKTSDKHQFKYSYRFMVGDPIKSNIDTNYQYFLPFGHGEKYKIGQGYNGSFSHENAYALDFDMPMGASVTAARDGIVYEIKEDSNSGGVDKKYINDANYLMIYHDDGTVGQYAHFKKDGIIVTLGQRVKKGQLLGYVGNTGYSSGPHLHFQINQILKMSFNSIPTKFIQSKNLFSTLQEGKYYYGYDPAVDKENPKTGEQLNNADYNTTENTEFNNKIQITTETVDFTTVFYVKNGFKKNIKIKVEFEEIQNMSFSKPLPYEVNVPQGTKMFLFLGKAIDNKKTMFYKYKFTYWE